MSICVDIVVSAVTGKYPVQYEDIKKISDHIYGLSKIDSFDLLEKRASKLIKEETFQKVNDEQFIADILRQLLLCNFIRESLQYTKLDGGTLESFHCFLFGDTRPVQRTDSYVSDFGGVPPIDIKLIDTEYHKLTTSITKISLSQNITQKKAAFYLAYLFQRIISIHYFMDGNGRVARFTCLYFCYRWGFNPVLIPKVRNDAEWKHALETAVKGNDELLQSWFLKRLSKKSNV